MDTIKRLLLESDFLKEDELHTSQRRVRDLLEDAGMEIHKNDVFDTIIDHAWNINLDKAWKALKTHDEVYGNSSLMPLAGAYMGSPVIFNTFMERALKENITGKKLILLVPFKNLHFGMIDVPVIRKVFSKKMNNEFLTLERENGKRFLKPVNYKEIKH